MKLVLLERPLFYIPHCSQILIILKVDYKSNLKPPFGNAGVAQILKNGIGGGVMTSSLTVEDTDNTALNENF